ncbi:MAG: PEP-CTERM/exosortase system-associated acyltransferase [Gammaproteobacteria bacterium]
MNDLIRAFNQYFEVLAADTPELKNQVFRMRYQVYCEEIKLEGFERSDYSDGLERDEYDQRSEHYLLRHRGRNEYVGTVRLILPDLKNPKELFPLEAHAAGHFYEDAFSPHQMPRERTAEVSRLILSRSVRSRPGESDSPYSSADNIPSRRANGHRRFPHPVLGLVLAVIKLSAANGIRYWYAGMEPVLNRLLRRFGLELTPIGSVVQYHGHRQPFCGVIENVLREVYIRDPKVWALIREQGRLWPAPTVH